MTDPLITVLITTYNYGRFVREAIDSVLAQQFPPETVEIVVVDDGSTDDTAERIAEYGSRVRYFRKENGGQASALNLGFAEARGEIVALLDADDQFLPEKLARVAEAFGTDPAVGIVIHPMTEWDVNSKKRHNLTVKLFSGDLRANPHLFLSYYVLPASCISVRRRTVDQLLPIPESIRMLGDAFLVILTPMIAPVRALDEALTLYRIHGANSYYADEQNMPPETRTRRRRQVLTLIEEMLKWLADKGHTMKERHVRYFSWRWRLAREQAQFEEKPPGRWRSFLFLFQRNYVYRGLQTRGYTVVNYLTAALALLFGYAGALERRDRLLARLQHVAR